MKKSLLALAVLGAFAGAASAQSSVTIYGIVDLGVAKGNGGTANLGSGGTFDSTSKAYQLTSAYTSRLGFRGNEDLGGGLSAQFLLEHRFLPDTGASQSATVFWAGRSTVSLTSAQAGRVYLGREYTPMFLMASRVDPWGSNSIGQMYTYQFAGYSAETPAGVRTSNTVGYTTPTIGGLSATAAVALSETTQRGRDTSITAQYAAGPLFVGLGYEKVYKGTSPASARGQGLMMATAMYDLGFARLTGYYGRSKTASPLPGTVTATSGLGTIPITGVGVDTNHSAAFGALVPVGPGNLKFIYARVEPRRADNTRQKIGLGYDYNLSKRTTIYADGAFAKEDRRTDNRALMVGVRHFF